MYDQLSLLFKLLDEDHHLAENLYFKLIQLLELQYLKVWKNHKYWQRQFYFDRRHYLKIPFSHLITCLSEIILRFNLLQNHFFLTNWQLSLSHWFLCHFKFIFFRKFFSFFFFILLIFKWFFWQNLQCLIKEQTLKTFI